MNVHHMPARYPKRSEESTGCLETSAGHGSEPLCEYWQLSTGSLQEHQLPLAS